MRWKRGYHLLGIGEMGIGNTTAASALRVALCGLRLEEAVGRGTGIDEGSFQRKLEVVTGAYEKYSPAACEPAGALLVADGWRIRNRSHGGDPAGGCQSSFARRGRWLYRHGCRRRRFEYRSEVPRSLLFQLIARVNSRMERHSRL